MAATDYDYIVVGAGTAGCVVATRLAGHGRNRVLLVEAGGSDRRFWVRVPIGYGRTYNDPAVNWMYETEPDAGLNGTRSYWPRGRVLGGSGSINAMVYVRGLPRDYDDWRDAGNPGWGWSDVRPVFEAIESRLDGDGGMLRVTDQNAAAHPLCQAYIRSCAGLGYGYTADFNGSEPEGVGIYPTLTRRGLRDSTATSYLRPALGRLAIDLQLGAHVQGIEFEGLRATGIRYLRDGAAHSATARAGVVLCAGSIGSPQLLQLAGIGDPAQLAPLGIQVRHALPQVGRNLHDHLAVNYTYRSRVPTLNGQLHPWWGKLWAGIRYVTTRRGPLSMSVNQGGGFVRSNPALAAPDMQLYFNPASYTSTRTRTRRLMNPDAFPGFILSFNACRPTSRGHLVVRSRDPADAPLIHPNYLATTEDQADAIAGARLLRRIMAREPLAGLAAEELQPGVAVQDDAALLEDFRNRAGSVFHPVSTCAMGPDATRAVVDARLRVHGIAGLHVVDASVFPRITSGNTNGPVVVVAERGASMILEDGRRGA